MTALHYAVFFGHVECTNALIDAGAKLEKNLTYVNDSGQTFKTYSLLHLCVLNDQYDTAKILLKKGAKINQKDLSHETVLHKAASSLKLDFLKLFVEYKDKTNKADINSFNINYKTPLLFALNATDTKDKKEDKKAKSVKDPVSSKKYEVIEYLVSMKSKVQYESSDLPSKSEQQQYGYKSRVNKKEQIRTIEQPITLAVERGSPKLVRFFIKQGADVNCISGNYNYQTPLDKIEERIKNIEEKSKDDDIEPRGVKVKNTLPKKFEFLYFL